MAPWVSFDEIKSTISVEEILQSYELKVEKRKGEEFRVLCPFHEETKASFCWNTNGKFYCFGCHAKGRDILDFVARIEKHDPNPNKGRRQAAITIAERFGLSTSPPQREENVELTEPVVNTDDGEISDDQQAREENSESKGTDAQLTNPPLTFELKNIDPSHSYLVERGLSPETIETFGLGYFSGRGSIQGRVVIPIHNEDGELVAYAGRWPGEPSGDEPKYKLPHQFHKSLVVYNLHRAREHATEGLIVVEGFFSVFEFHQHGRKNVVAIMGSAMSEVQERLIVDCVGQRGRVLLAFDDDNAGRKGAKEAAERLVSKVFVRTVAIPK